MTPLTEILRAEITRSGPIPFRRFMDAALYHPEYGYYRRHREVFGKGGDFFTASQLQPVFGILIALRIRSLRGAMEDPEDFTVVELGAGRGDMAEALSEFRYVPVDVDRGALPGAFRGVVFSNEFFDALPVDAVVMRRGVPRQMLVRWNGDRFVWIEGDDAGDAVRNYLYEFFPPLEEDQIVEVSFDTLAWIERIASSLQSGFVFTVDYGYTRSELRRFPRGTLMSYRAHRADSDVLLDPGERDITAHVCFAALEKHGAQHDLTVIRRETLARTLLDAGESDQFEAVLTGGQERAQQLKTLLFGMGETFTSLLQRKGR